MTVRRAILALAVVLAGLSWAGQAGGQQVVTQGAFCSPAGATGVTSTGLPMVCTTSATDDRNRWRQAETAVTTSTTPTTSTVAGGTRIISITTRIISITTRIISITPPTTAAPSPAIGRGLLERTG